MKKYLFFILFFLLNINNAYSLIEVDITRGNLNPLPIAVSPLFSDSDTKQELNNETNISKLGEKISEVCYEKMDGGKKYFFPLFKKVFPIRKIKYSSCVLYFLN